MLGSKHPSFLLNNDTMAERTKAFDLKSKVRSTGGSNPSRFKFEESGAVVACLPWEQEVEGSIPSSLT